ncbi:hypothetical protein HanRHA438_Chr01g0044691 [Helianthus annuus]|nr:hypothetical protein HanRHA438_Chr01g0044691 [Helianthus annuus]
MTPPITPFTKADKTANNSHKFAFTLTPTNYANWQAMIHPFLVTNDLFGYVDGSIPCPPELVQPPLTEKSSSETSESVPNPGHRAWISNDAHIRMLISSTISEKCFQHVQTTKTSRELWEALRRTYAPQTSAREFTIRSQFLRLQMHGDETTTAYLDRAQEYATALANIGKPMDEKDILMLVVSGLREEYNGVKQILFSRDYTAVFTELPALLADHEYMIKKPISDVPPVHAFTAHTTPSSSIPDETLQSLQQLVTKLGFQLQPQSSSSSASTANSNGGSSSSPSAYYTSRGRGRGGNGFNRGGRFTQSRGTSYNRGGSSQFSWASNQNTVYGSCNRCGIGHLPTHCPNRDPSTIRSRQPISNFTDFRSQNSQSWITDTGSNSHVSPDMQGFDSAQSYFGEDNLHVGNGHVYTSYPPHGSK